MAERIIDSAHETLGCAFRVAARAMTLADALKAIASERFDVALVDLGLPDAKRSRAVAEIARVAPDLPQVVWTGDADQCAEAMAAGAEECLSKTSPRMADRLPMALAVAYHRNCRDRCDVGDARQLAAESRSLAQSSGGNLGRRHDGGYAETWALAAFVMVTARLALAAVS